MPANTINIQLQAITCVETSEPGSDEVYIKYSADGGREQRFPSSSYHSMSAGDVWDVNLPLSYKETLVVSLYDNDFGNDDFLGSHTYQTTDPQPETVEVSNTNGAVYTLSSTPGTAD